MVGNVTIQGQIIGAATFDGAKISAVVTIAQPINATVVFGKSGVTIHNQLTGRDDEDAHPIEAISTPVNDNSNIYWWIRSTLLTGLAVFSDAAITAGDSILSAFAKLQGQLNAIKVRLGLLEDNIIYTETLANDITAFEYQITGLNLLKNKTYRLLIFCPANGTVSGQFILRFNNNSSVIYQRATTITTGFLIQVGYTATRASFEFVLADNGDLWGRDWIAYNNGGSYNRTGEANATYGARWSNISVISIFKHSMGKIPAGSVITLIRG